MPLVKRKPKPNAMIVVESDKKRIFRYIEPTGIPSDSFEKKYQGKWMHILGQLPDGKYWVIKPNPPEEGRLPTDLYMALHCADEVNTVYGMSMPVSHMIGIGMLVLFGICDLVVFFLIVTTLIGGGA